jgi:DNA polymerase III subunit delta'
MSFVRVAPEQHDTLPEIPEPAENPHLFGHGEAMRHLAGAYREGRLHHGLILAGPAGIGKATFAFHLARHLLRFPDANAAPDGFQPDDPASTLFRLVAQGAHPSVLHLTRPINERTKSFRTALTADEVRKVGRFLSMTSHDGGYRVVIVDPADDMNVHAANALLKNLEEPPPRTLFALISHSSGNLLPTLRSRCQVVRMSPLEDEDLVAALKSVPGAGSEAQDGFANVLANAGGSVREALMMTRFGGAEIGGAVEAVTRDGRFDVAAAWRIAEAVTGKDSEMQFRLFTTACLDMVTAAAGEAGRAGELHRAARLAELARELTTALDETETYNLDKRQFAMATLRRLHGELPRMAASG